MFRTNDDDDDGGNHHVTSSPLWYPTLGYPLLLFFLPRRHKGVNLPVFTNRIFYYKGIIVTVILLRDLKRVQKEGLDFRSKHASFR